MLVVYISAAAYLIVQKYIPGGEDFALLSFVLIGLVSISNIAQPRLLYQRFASFLLSISSVAFVCMAFYQRSSGLDFDIWQIVDNPTEALKSVYLFWGLLTSVTLFVVACSLIMVTNYLLLRALPSLEKKIRGTSRFARFATYGALSLFILGPSIFRGAYVVRGYAVDNGLTPVDIIWESLPSAQASNGESLFILQLESLNSSALFHKTAGTYRPVVDLPGAKLLEEKGAVWFPRFWASNVGTHMGTLSILCGASGTLGYKIIEPPSGHECLPEVFKKAGYRTDYYYSFNEGDFYSLESKVALLGFENFYFGEKLMEPTDEFFSWGYNDCTFYHRAFDHMKASRLKREKSFTYFSVHMNHAPFARHLKIKHPFEDPTSLEQTYVNSAFEQDHCLKEFVERFEALDQDDIHLMIVGDHSFPVRDRKEMVDAYSTGFWYLPPKKRRPEFAPGARPNIRPAQDQIASTAVDLIFGSKNRSSFAWALKGQEKPDFFRDCHLIADPLKRSAFVVREDEAIEISLRKRRFYQYQEENDFSLKRELLTHWDWSDVKMPRNCLKPVQRGISSTVW